MVSFNDFANSITDSIKMTAMQTIEGAMPDSGGLSAFIQNSFGTIASNLPDKSAAPNFYIHLCKQIKDRAAQATSSSPGCTDSESQRLLFIDSFDSIGSDAASILYDDLLADGTLNVTNVDDVANLTDEALGDFLSNLPCAHSYKHAIAAEIIADATAYLEDSTVTYSYYGVLKDNSGALLENTVIQLHDNDADATYEAQELDFEFTDSAGRFVIDYDIIDNTTPVTRNIEIKVFNSSGTEISTSTQAAVDPTDTSEHEITTTQSVETPETFPDWTALQSIGFTVDTDLQTRLGALSPAVTDLEDIQEAGGLLHITSVQTGIDLSEYTSAHVEQLEAHAELYMVSTNTTVNDALIAAGYLSIADIASKTRVKFIADAISNTSGLGANALTNYLANLIHAKSVALAQYLSTVGMGISAQLTSDIDTSAGYEN